MKQNKATAEVKRAKRQLEAIRAKLVCDECKKKPLLIHVAGDDGAREGSLCQHAGAKGVSRCPGKLKLAAKPKRDERADCAAPCATCPFKRENFSKPNPEGYDPRQAEAARGGKFFDWYSPDNLRRLWRGGIREGEAMICHATDPRASAYGGRDAAPGQERICTGSLVIVFRHLKHLEKLSEELPKLEAFKHYREASLYPMPRRGLIAWAWKIVHGRTDLMGGLPLPRTLPQEALDSCGLPWRDFIVNESEAQS